MAVLRVFDTPGVRGRKIALFTGEAGTALFHIVYETCPVEGHEIERVIHEGLIHHDDAEELLDTLTPAERPDAIRCAMAVGIALGRRFRDTPAVSLN